MWRLNKNIFAQSSRWDFSRSKISRKSVPLYNLPCRFSDYRVLISSSGWVKTDDENKEEEKPRSTKLLEVCHSLGGGLRIPRVPPFDSIASYLSLDSRRSYLPPDFIPLSSLRASLLGPNLPEIPGRTARSGMSNLYQHLRSYKRQSEFVLNSNLI